MKTETRKAKSEKRNWKAGQVLGQLHPTGSKMWDEDLVAGDGLTAEVVSPVTHPGGFEDIKPNGDFLLKFLPAAIAEEVQHAALDELRRQFAFVAGRRQSPDRIGGNTFEPLPRSMIAHFNPERRPATCTRPELLLAAGHKGKAGAPLLNLRVCVDHVFIDHVFNEWTDQAQVATKVVGSPKMGTAFTRMTVNRNWATALHRDAEADGRPMFGLTALTVLGAVERRESKVKAWEGCLTVLPEHGIAVDMRPGAVLIFDGAHELHGNTPLRDVNGHDFERAGRHAERYACVFYCENPEVT